MPSDRIALYSSDHMCVRESFHRSVNMFVRALSNDTFQEQWTVCQTRGGSLEGSSAPRILDPEHAQM